MVVDCPFLMVLLVDNFESWLRVFKCFHKTVSGRMVPMGQHVPRSSGRERSVTVFLHSWAASADFTVGWTVILWLMMYHNTMVCYYRNPWLHRKVMPLGGKNGETHGETSIPQINKIACLGWSKTFQTSALDSALLSHGKKKKKKLHDGAKQQNPSWQMLVLSGFNKNMPTNKLLNDGICQQPMVQKLVSKYDANKQSLEVWPPTCCASEKKRSKPSGLRRICSRKFSALTWQSQRFIQLQRVEKKSCGQNVKTQPVYLDLLKTPRKNNKSSQDNCLYFFLAGK